MGHLRQGVWKSGDVVTSNDQGEFDREKTTFRESISLDHPQFKPEKNRYHLYVSYACPWAHRTLIVRELKGLNDIIDVSVVHPDMLEHSWTFDSSFEGATGDQLYGLNYLYQIYQKSDPNISCKVTVPVLWDKKTEQIVNNESSEIMRLFNTSFDDFTDSSLDLYPKHLQSQIDSINEWVYKDINNGVYKTGFAQNQKAYEKSFKALFAALDRVDTILEKNDYLVQGTLTEADIRLFTTLVRFDSVYYVHFKCNGRRIKDYPNISKYFLKMLNTPEILRTVDQDHIKRHYYFSHDFINPKQIVPLGPLDLNNS
ncbi:glutathione S-transferase family protein [bacterium]|nr:glutathione S-transferase family protein [bacterium]